MAAPVDRSQSGTTADLKKKLLVVPDGDIYKKKRVRKKVLEKITGSGPTAAIAKLGDGNRPRRLSDSDFKPPSLAIARLMSESAVEDIAATETEYTEVTDTTEITESSTQAGMSSDEGEDLLDSEEGTSAAPLSRPSSREIHPNGEPMEQADFPETPTDSPRTIKKRIKSEEIHIDHNFWQEPANAKKLARCQAYVRGRFWRIQWKEYMTKMREKRTHIAREIVSTEQTYVQQLTVISTLFLRPLREEARKGADAFITMDQIKTIFSDIEIILGYNTMLLKKLTQRVDNWSPTQKIGDVFLELNAYLKVYTQYCNSYKDAIATLGKLKTNAPFQKFLETVHQRPECHNLTLRDHLITPVQRLPRYTLLLADLVKHTPTWHVDYENITKALKSMQEVANYVNESQDAAERVQKVLEVQQKLVGKHENLAQPHRRYMLEGEVSEMTSRREGARLRPYYLFLFNDLLIWTKPKKSDAPAAKRGAVPAKDQTYQVKRMDPLTNVLFVTDISAELSGSRSAFCIGTTEYRIDLLTKNKLENTKWVDTIRRCVEMQTQKRQTRNTEEKKKVVHKQLLEVANAKSSGRKGGSAPPSPQPATAASNTAKRRSVNIGGIPSSVSHPELSVVDSAKSGNSSTPEAAAAADDPNEQRAVGEPPVAGEVKTMTNPLLSLDKKLLAGNSKVASRIAQFKELGRSVSKASQLAQSRSQSSSRIDLLMHGLNNDTPRARVLAPKLEQELEGRPRASTSASETPVPPVPTKEDASSDARPRSRTDTPGSFKSKTLKPGSLAKFMAKFRKHKAEAEEGAEESENADKAKAKKLRLSGSYARPPV